MACVTLTVTSPAKTITLSNVGFGSETQRYAICTTLANQDIGYIWFDYVITNPGVSNVIDGQVTFMMPGNAFPTAATFSVSVSAASGTLGVNLQQGRYSPGNWTGATAQATVT